MSETILRTDGKFCVKRFFRRVSIITKGSERENYPAVVKIMLPQHVSALKI